MNPGSATNTPHAITPQIQEFCARLVASPKLKLVSVQPTAQSALNDCFHNVSDHVKANGGTSVLGWTIWEWPGTLIEAEFHCVWLSRGGELIDITPKPDADREVLFVCDERAKFDVTNPPPPRPNVREPLTSHPAMVEFLAAARDREQLVARHWRGRHAEIPAAELNAVNLRLAQAVRDLRSRKVGRNDPCPCGSTQKFKRCCGA